MRIQFDTSDIGRLSAEFDYIQRGVDNLTRVAIRKTAFDIVATAQFIAPVDTGAFKNSIGVDFDPSGLGAEIGPTVYYAPFLEYGTSRMSPQPTMGPAFDANIGKFIEALRQITDIFGR